MNLRLNFSSSVNYVSHFFSLLVFQLRFFCFLRRFISVRLFAWLHPAFYYACSLDVGSAWVQHFFSSDTDRETLLCHGFLYLLAANLWLIRSIYRLIFRSVVELRVRNQIAHVFRFGLHSLALFTWVWIMGREPHQRKNLEDDLLQFPYRCVNIRHPLKLLNQSICFTLKKFPCTFSWALALWEQHRNHIGWKLGPLPGWSWVCLININKFQILSWLTMQHIIKRIKQDILYVESECRNCLAFIIQF